MIESITFDMVQLRKHFSRYCGACLEKIGLSRGMLFFIIYIGKNPGCRPTEVSEALRMDAGHIARSLKKLEQDGFIKKTRCYEDKRVYVLELTERGKKAFEISYRVFAEWDQKILKSLDQEEQVVVSRLVKKMKKAICEEEGGNTNEMCSNL